jgi:uncharacterized membrane-anchored protein
VTISKLLRKVPEITVIFWVVKLLTTALGESTSDFLVYKINPYLAVAIGGAGLVVALTLQFSVRKYIPWIYWLAVVMVAIFGTMAADAIHIQLGIPYVVSTILFAIILVVVFAIWYKSEKALSIHSINTYRRELFYWATVMATFALGTAAGDMTAFTLQLGFFTSIVLFASLIAIIALIYWLFRINSIIAFWFAYILTRPLGASIADWASKPKTIGGLGFGDGYVSLALTILIIFFVAYITHSQTGVKRKGALQQTITTNPDTT